MSVKAVKAKKLTTHSMAHVIHHMVIHAHDLTKPGNNRSLKTKHRPDTRAITINTTSRTYRPPVDPIRISLLQLFTTVKVRSPLATGDKSPEPPTSVFPPAAEGLGDVDGDGAVAAMAELAAAVRRS